MSIETWKEEFYPITVREFTLQSRSTLELLEHALKKWKGLTEENRKKHHVQKAPNSRCLRGTDADFPLHSESCSLCRFYSEHHAICSRCPLYNVRGVSCDDVPQDSDNELLSPWNEFLIRSNPQPMIALLEEAIRRAEAEVL